MESYGESTSAFKMPHINQLIFVLIDLLQFFTFFQHFLIKWSSAFIIKALLIVAFS